jgi:hypothetical protein
MGLKDMLAHQSTNILSAGKSTGEGGGCGQRCVCLLLSLSAKCSARQSRHIAQTYTFSLCPRPTHCQHNQAGKSKLVRGFLLSNSSLIHFQFNLLYAIGGILEENPPSYVDWRRSLIDRGKFPKSSLFVSA